MNPVLHPSSFPSRRRRNEPRPGVLHSEPRWPTEEDSHREHRAALEATLLQTASPVDELIFELEDGRLSLRATRR